MSRTRSSAALLIAAACAVALIPGSAAAGPPSPQRVGYQAADACAGHCNDVLPPGENGNATLADILANRTLGTRPAHTDDQLGKYASLLDNYQNLTDSTIGTYYNDSSFGVPSDQVASTTKPRSDVSIIRDKATGVPHIIGTTRSGTEYGAGYAAAQDRLWLMDLFRHVGRGQLTGFAGGAPGNRQLEQQFYTQAPYTEQDLQDQVNRVAASGARGKQALSDVNDYVAGVNAYIDKAYNGRTFPGEYDLTGHVDPITNAGGIDHFKATDLVAIGSVIGALFGAGGGGEVSSALAKEAFDAQYGQARGDALWQAFRMRNDPEAVLTVHDGQTYPYGDGDPHGAGVAMPDAGSVTPQQLVYDPTGSAGNNTAAPSTRAAATAPTGGRQDLSAARGIFNNGVLPANLFSEKHGMSNALVVSGKYGDGGHPLAVFGPQTGYFAPQLLMLEELQGPGISSRGAAFAGLSFYVQLGRGQDYSWSATSAEQDIIDTYAVSLCNADGSPATKDSMSYLYHGQCLPMEKLERDDAWKPTLADNTAAGSYKLIMYRTKYGLVQYRATVGGKPVAFASLRSSYRHEVDSIIGFQELNDPSYLTGPAAFQHATGDINYTFNWFYVDSAHSAYYNSGSNPVRPSGVDPDLPAAATPADEWKGWNPDTNVADYTPAAQHPQSVDQDYYVSWNNKQALQYSSSMPEGTVHRGNLLDDRVKALVKSGRPVTRSDLTKAMEDAAGSDLRGEDVLPLALKVIDAGGPVTDPDEAKAVAALRTWIQHGTRRQAAQAGGKTYADADAVRIMDAWWPLWMAAEFKPGLGDATYAALQGVEPLHDAPAAAHHGSAFQRGWYSYTSKDLRTVLGEQVAGPLGASYCGNGDKAACRTALLSSLKQAAAEPASQVYPGDGSCSAGDQWCADSIIQQPLGGITDDKIAWQNRPTFQQSVQYQSHR